MGRKAIDIAGQRFGKLIAVERAGNARSGDALWRCDCDCGGETVATSNDLRRGRAQGCANENPVQRTHGHSGKNRTPEYRAWSSIIDRCENPSCRSYPNYGGRGITLAPEWRKSFEAFLEHVGPRPSSRHSIDRIDNDRGYEPGNIRWATPRQQTRNTRATKLTAEMAREIVDRAARGESEADLALAFGVTKNHIYGVLAGRVWSDATGVRRKAS